jgi:F0F1-type ATP synthase assembly protein I
VHAGQRDATVPGSDDDQRPPIVVAVQWVSQITTVSLELVIPSAGGYWLDQHWGTSPWLLICGVAFGFAVFMYHLLQMVGMAGKRSSRSGCARPKDES